MPFMLRGVRYGNNLSKIDSIYIVDDPWCMSSQGGQYRFTETTRLILEKFGRLGSLLEIGCGGGHQSLHLRKLCNRVEGELLVGHMIPRLR
jgi:hypothetical protein